MRGFVQTKLLAKIVFLIYKRVMIKLLPSLFDLRMLFRNNGFDIKLCGGCVRDWLLLHDNHDIDLCTDATPEEQVLIYQANGVQHIDTGLKHGTWTVVLDNQTFEITSLRTETDCDGRYATVSYTRDWELDLSRRDLTINAMLMSFEGEITDPFNGQQDLQNNVIRFVGNPDERMREDYLRILRWFRFHARFGKGQYSIEDVYTTLAIKRNVKGLLHISRERVWSEFRRILVEPFGLQEIVNMLTLDVAKYIDLPTPFLAKRSDVIGVGLADTSISFRRLEVAHRYTKDPVTLMAAYLGSSILIEEIANKWHWSAQDRDQAMKIANYNTINLEFAKYQVAVFAVPVYWMAELLRSKAMVQEATELENWTIPQFPVTGHDLLARGIAPGPNLGQLLLKLKKCWAESNYTLTLNDLLDH